MTGLVRDYLETLAAENAASGRKRREFLDTNVLVYAYDSGDARKRQIAQNLIRRALTGDIVFSTQVLAEFSATLLHKVSPAVKPGEVAALLDALGPIKLVALDGDVVRRAVEARQSTASTFTME